MFKKDYQVYGVWVDIDSTYHVETFTVKDAKKKEAIDKMYYYLCHDKAFKQVSFRNVIKVFCEKKY